jgi:hypothetical protein
VRPFSGVRGTPGFNYLPEVKDIWDDEWEDEWWIRPLAEEKTVHPAAVK